ncbi:MAG TPA: hypothetical protein VGW38_23625 [Chloroflexota bacterium]|nr:hypothetical protein [Chloroflexota bacterium]
MESTSRPEASPAPAAAPDYGQQTPGETPPEAIERAIALPPTPEPEPSQPPRTATAEDATEERKQEDWLRFWLHPMLLGILVLILIVLTYWDNQRIPTRPMRPNVLMATPQAGAIVSPSDPALLDILARLRQALSRRDARALSSLADPEGVIVAAYGGALPDSGYTVPDVASLSRDALRSGQISILGWRDDGRGRIIVLTDGWALRRMSLSANSTLEQTSLLALGLVSNDGIWYWRWFLPDSAGVLSQQARGLAWQPFAN